MCKPLRAQTQAWHPDGLGRLAGMNWPAWPSHAEASRGDICPPAWLDWVYVFSQPGGGHLGTGPPGSLAMGEKIEGPSFSVLC